ncbi:MAG: class I SAM-dependent methyltransferase [Desulfobaccales bacterium]
MQLNKLMHRLTYDIWRRTLPRYGNLTKGTLVLECGIGPGNLLSLMSRWFPEAKLYGLDIDLQYIRQTGQADNKMRLLAASAEALPFQPGIFDLIISLHMVEHLPQPEKFFAEAARVLCPGGILAIATPNPDGVGARMMGSRWGGWQNDHISLKSSDKWQKMIIEQGFSVLSEGTTGISGIPAFRRLPLAIFNWGPLFLFGFFPWRHGEAYICISRKAASQ